MMIGWEEKGGIRRGEGRGRLTGRMRLVICKSVFRLAEIYTKCLKRTVVVGIFVERMGHRDSLRHQHRIKRRHIKRLVSKRLIDMTAGQSAVCIPLSPAQ